MAIKVRLMGMFKELLNQQEVLIEEEKGNMSILDLISYLDTLSNGQFRQSCLNKEGELIYSVLIIVNGTEISALQKLNTLVSNDSEVVFLPTIHGG